MEVSQAAWARVEELFDLVVALPAAEREATLARACQGLEDEEWLHGEVTSLLASAEGASGAIHRALALAAETVLDREVEALVGRQLGPYRVLGLIGQGGMGAVYLAERADDQFHLRVAIKVVQRGLGGPEVRARFRDERQILATLDHPSIVRILDGGETVEGQPYLVMEHVEGAPLGEFVRGLPVRARLELVVRIGAALAYAHGKLVVHRDIKPSNVLVGAGGMPKLLDFGIAKILESATVRGDRRTRTLTGMALMTPEYASPEQARGDRVTVAADVYSLGAVLFELLAGRPPHEPTDDALRMLRSICEVDPPRPSTVAPRELASQMSADLDSIVLRALQKDPANRYPSVAAMCQDLQRLLDGEPVLAHEATLGYRASKYLLRHRLALSVGAAVVLLLSAATAISIGQARRADRHAREADRQSRILLAAQGAQQLDNGHHGPALAYLAAALRAGEDTPTVRFQIAEAARPFEQVIATLRDNESGITAAAWSPTGKRFCTAGADGTVWIYDATGRPERRLTGGPRSPVAWFSDDDRWLLCRGWEDVQVWNVETGQVQFKAAFSAGMYFSLPTRLPFRSLTSRLPIPGHLGEVRIWDFETGQLVFRYAVPDTTLSSGVAITSDGKTLLIGGGNGAIHAIDVASGQQRFELVGHATHVFGLALSRDGTRLYSQSTDQSLRIWDLERRAEVAVVAHAIGREFSTVVDSRGQELLAVSSRDWGVRLFDVRTGRVVAEHRIDASGPRANVDSSGRLLAAASAKGFSVIDLSSGQTISRFEMPPIAGTAPHSVGGQIAARLSPDGSRLLSASGAEVELRRVDGGPRIEVLDTRGDGATPRNLYSAVANGSGRLIATAGFDSNQHLDVHVLERLGESDALASAKGPPGSGGWRLLAELGATSARIWDVSFSPDGQRLVAARDDRVAIVYRIDGRSPPLTLGGHAGAVNRAQFSPDGTRIVTASDDHSARIWDAASGSLVRTLPHPDRVMAAQWSAPGDRIVTAGWDGSARIWDSTSGALTQTITRPEVQLLDAGFSPDGRALVTATHGGEVLRFDLAAPERPLLLAGNHGPVPTAVFSPDGLVIATAADSGTIGLYDAASGQLIGQRETGSDEMLQVSFLPGGRSLVAATTAGAMLFDVHRDERPVAAIEAWLAAHVPWRLDHGHLELVHATKEGPAAATSP